MLSRPIACAAGLLLLSLSVATGACRAAEGQSCREADDCRDGLVCVVNGVALEPGAAPSTAVGECLEDDTLPESR
jgi:hypothetical protein